MSQKEIRHELDTAATQLEMLVETFFAIEIAESEGETHVPRNALTLPCVWLKDLSETITNLVNELFENKEAVA